VLLALQKQKRKNNNIHSLACSHTPQQHTYIHIQGCQSKRCQRGIQFAAVVVIVALVVFASLNFKQKLAKDFKPRQKLYPKKNKHIFERALVTCLGSFIFHPLFFVKKGRGRHTHTHNHTIHN